jgi:CLIP-associating protein 1/2
MSTERLEKLINQCKSNGWLFTLEICHSKLKVPTDVDQKVDAVTKLQAEFESGIEVRARHIYKE